MIENKFNIVKGSENSKQPIPKILIVCFLSTHFAFGLNFGFSKILKETFQCLANCFCCFLSIFFITAIIIQVVFKAGDGTLTGSLWLINGLVQYSLHAGVLHCSKYNLYNFIVDIYSVEINILGNKKKDNLFVNLNTIIFMIVYAIKSSLCYMLCETNKVICATHYVPGYVYCIVLMALDVITLVQILIYYYVYKVAKYLKVSLEDKDIKWVRKQFTAVADICNKISPIYERLVSTMFSLLFSIRFWNETGWVECLKSFFFQVDQA